MFLARKTGKEAEVSSRMETGVNEGCRKLKGTTASKTELIPKSVSKIEFAYVF